MWLLVNQVRPAAPSPSHSMSSFVSPLRHQVDNILCLAITTDACILCLYTHATHTLSALFEVDVTQMLNEGDGIEAQTAPQDVALLFSSCQRQFCFDVSLRGETSRPSSGEQFDISLVASPDHGRAITVDPDKTRGLIESR